MELDDRAADRQAHSTALGLGREERGEQLVADLGRDAAAVVGNADDHLLGAAPGGWSQVAAKRVGGGRVLALDLLEMVPLAGVEFFQGDFREDAVLAELTLRLGGRPVELVISDMAPNISGIAISDQARSMHLAELALEFAVRHLKLGGNFLVKTFEGAGSAAFRKTMNAAFEKVVVRKPKSSRDRSNEVYLIGMGCRPQ